MSKVKEQKSKHIYHLCGIFYFVLLRVSWVPGLLFPSWLIIVSQCVIEYMNFCKLREFPIIACLNKYSNFISWVKTCN